MTRRRTCPDPQPLLAAPVHSQRHHRIYLGVGIDDEAIEGWEVVREFVYDAVEHVSCLVEKTD